MTIDETEWPFVSIEDDCNRMMAKAVDSMIRRAAMSDEEYREKYMVGIPTRFCAAVPGSDDDGD